jgi:hypothetical protein
MRGKEHFNSLYTQALLSDSITFMTVWDILYHPLKLDFPVEVKTDLAYLMWMSRKLSILEDEFVIKIKRLVANGVFKLALTDPLTNKKGFSSDPEDLTDIYVVPADFFRALSIWYAFAAALKAKGD